jgi:hypothetical protein
MQCLAMKALDLELLVIKCQPITRLINGICCISIANTNTNTNTF